MFSQVLEFKHKNHIGLQSLPPLSLYVHIPWCLKKCPYCDFNSHERRDEDEARYVAALIRDLEQALPLIWGRSVSSIFFGGGTPSLLSVAVLEQLLQTFSAYLRLSPEAEITLEANPGTAEAAKFAAFRAAGINRLSIGVQTFNDDVLKRLGRVHDAAQARAAVELAAKYFDHFNLDLMYALPTQTPEMLMQDLDFIKEFSPPHLSAYHLTMEPNTAFGRQPPPDLPDDDLAADMQELLEQALDAMGMKHYETAAFCKKNQECRHNLNYWQFGDYLGIGAGAHGKISFHDKIMRYAREKSPSKYLNLLEKNEKYYTEIEVSDEDKIFEFMMNALRLQDGFSPRLFVERTGLSSFVLQAPLKLASAQGFLDVSPDWICPTPLGRRFLNDLLAIFLPETA